MIKVACLAAGLFSGQAQAGQHCLVFGDSISKEYQVEFPVLYPSNPISWAARNWIEILSAQRSSWFDLGSFGDYYDPRIVGHQFDWAFPGATTQDIHNRIYSRSWYDSLWQKELRSELAGSVNRVVIFAGGNDVAGYYGDLYNGKSPTLHINTTRDNLMSVVDYVRSVNSHLPIVLVAVPHVGFTPHVQASYPTNTLKTGRVTAALDSLNAQLAALTKTRGIAFCSGSYDLTKSLITGKFSIGGVPIAMKADPNCLPTSAFSGDGFHPGTSIHARLAQMVLDTFRTQWPGTPIPPLTDIEILTKVLVKVGP